MIKSSNVRAWALAAGLAILASPSMTGAVVLFSDDFNRANSPVVGNGWIELEADPTDVSIINNVLRMVDNRPQAVDAGVAHALISTLGHGNIVIEFDYRGTAAAAAGDTLMAAVRVGAGLIYFEVGSFDLTTSGHALIPLSAAVNDVSDLRLLLWTDVGETSASDSAGALIDNVVVSGTIPEPSTLALMLLLPGLAATRALQRRAKQS